MKSTHNPVDADVSEGKMALDTGWDPDYSVGHVVLDRYHQRLFELSSKTLAYVESPSRCSKTLRRLLAELLVYVDAHFQVEEAILRQHDFPHLTDHRAAHDQCFEKMKQILSSSDDSPVDEVSMCRRLAVWCRQHILDLDMAYSQYLLRAA
jgi:hemerythrin